MRAVGVLLVVLTWLSVQTAHAEPRNSYGTKGRTVLSGGLGALVHGSGYTQTHDAWRVSARATLAHFVRDNFALGGTFVMDLNRLRDIGSSGDVVGSYLGGDLDLIGHLPLSRHLSLRFWGWVGMRQRRREVTYVDPFEGDELVTSQKLLNAVVGFSPTLLIHCSSSVALALGPSFAAFAPLNARAEWDWSLNAGPSITYSFGSPPSDERASERFVPRFAARGRNVLTGGLSLGSAMGGSVGYARFLIDHFALGPRLFGGANDRQNADYGPRQFWAGVGVQMLAELPLRGRWSMLFLSEIDYRYDEFASWEDDPFGYTLAGRRSLIATHELQFRGSVLPVFHLFEALVFGLGPTITEHVRVAASEDGLDPAYLSLGVTSLLAGSF